MCEVDVDEALYCRNHLDVHRLSGCAKDEPPRPEDGVALTVRQSQQAAISPLRRAGRWGANAGEPQAAASSPDSGSAVLSDAEDSTDQARRAPPSCRF
jgi:hypothetical protein